MDNELQCKICNYIATNRQSFNNHLKSHKIKSKDYYDEYLKMPNDGSCTVCGRDTNFRNMWYGYEKHCSNSCAQLDPTTKNKIKTTCIKKYGTEYVFQSEQVKNKIKETMQEHYGVNSFLSSDEIKNKTKETSIKKYGTEYPSQSKEVKDKIKKASEIRYGVSYSFQSDEVKNKSKATKLARYNDENYNNSDKAKETNLSKYGVENPTQSNIVRDKMKQTCLERYGVDNAYKSRELMYGAKAKSRSTRSKNGNDSALEDYLEELLQVNNIKYEKHYNLDSRYPYFCDFYLPDSDCFIELNGFVSHNTHWFDETNKDDIKIIEQWKEKSKIHSMYSSFIYTWTISDVAKRNCAKNNNLNYVVLWNKEDITNWSKAGFEIRKDW